MKRISYVLLGIVVGVLALWTYQRLLVPESSRDTPSDMKTARVDRGTVVATVFAVGNVIPNRQANLAFSSIGTITEVSVTVGALVESGQVLASLDTTDQQTEIANAKLNLVIRKAELAKTRAGPSQVDVAAAQSAVEAAKEAVAAVEAGPNPAAVTTARTALQAAQARYDRVKSEPDPDSIRQAELQVEHAKNSLWNVQTERDMACSVETNSTSLCDSFQAKVGNGHVEIQMAELALERAKLPATDAELQSAWAEVQKAQETLDQLSASPDPAVLSAARAELTRAETQLEKAKAGPSTEDLQIAQARVDQAELALHQAQQGLANATLKSPFAGVVTMLKYQAGDMVRSEAAGATVADLLQLKLLVNVAEIDINQIWIGQEADVTLDALPGQVLSGQVENIAPESRSEQGVVNYPVNIVLTDTNAEVKPGMTGSVSIIVSQRENVLFVPNRAIRQSRGERIVAVLKGEELIEVPVQTGLSNETVTEVVGDLQEGDRVLLGATTIQSGLNDGLTPESNQ